MAFNTEILITLQQIKGLGNKSILEFAKSVDIDDMGCLWKSIQKIGKGRFSKITEPDLLMANRSAQRIIEASKTEGIGILSYFDVDFPQILRECVDEKGKTDPPIVLYYRGNIAVLKKPGVAIIGTREPTENGKKAGLYFSKEFARHGFNIVSGLATGCDTYAHRGALEANGTTTAFLATSLNWDEIYPKENRDLAEEIVKNGGLLMSEYHLGQNSGRYAFVARDRLQAGLSFATLAIQTDIHGGTMHAVNATIAAHKILFMVKYNRSEDLNSPKTQGNIKLINEGFAKPLTSATLDDAISTMKTQVNIAKEKSKAKNTSLFDFQESKSISRNIKGVIFDLDLTLVDTSCLEEARHNRDWQETYRLIPQTSMYPGVKETLSVIKQAGIKIAIVSTAPYTYIEKIVNFYQIPAQYIVGYHDAKPIKPHPASMLKALELMGENANNVISFGDRAIDIQASNAAGIESVACMWGSKECEKLKHSGCMELISTPQEIISIIRS